MSEPENKIDFIKNLIAQDPPPAQGHSQHKDILLKKIRHRMGMAKAVVIAIFMVLFLSAIGASMLAHNTNDAVHSICWGTASMHIILWTLVYILRGLHQQMEEIMMKISGPDKIRRYKIPLFITIVAVLVFVVDFYNLYRMFSLDDPLKAAHKANAILWVPVTFLILYPFATASLNAELWFEYKKMELSTAKPSNEGL